MKSTALALLAAAANIERVIATYKPGNNWKDANPYSCPGNIDNRCTEKQETGWDWSDLSVGSVESYGGFDFNGWTCENEFGKRDGHMNARTFGSAGRSIAGDCSSDKGDTPYISAGANVDIFSVDRFEITTEFDARLEFHYEMPDGSTCKHSAQCSSHGTTIQNSQCGGANKIHIVYPGHADQRRKTCRTKIHRLWFDCGKHKPQPPPQTFSAQPSSAQTPSATYETTPSARETQPPYEATTTSYETQPTYEATTAYDTTLTSEITLSFESTISSYATEPPYETSASYETIRSTPSYETSSVYETQPSYETTTSYGVTSAHVTTASYQTTTAYEGPTASEETQPPYETSSASYETTTTAYQTLPNYDNTTSASYVTNVGTTAAETTASGTYTTVYQSTSTVFTTSIVTVTGCLSEVVSCPFRSDSPAFVTVTVPVSTTVCPVTEIISKTHQDVPAEQTQQTQQTTELASPTTVKSPKPTEPTEPTLPCPAVLPKCLNTWMHIKPECRDNTDAACYCLSKDFVDNIFQCIYSYGKSGDDISAAIIFFQGVCAGFAPQNPVIATGAETITSIITVTGTPAAPASDYTTVVIATTITEPYISDGTTVPGSSTTKWLSTELTVPQVGFTTGPETPAPTSADTTATDPDSQATIAVPTFITSPAFTFPAGTGTGGLPIPPSNTGIPVVAGAAHLGTGMGLGLAIMAAIVSL